MSDNGDAKFTSEFPVDRIKVDGMTDRPLIESDHDRGRFWAGFDAGLLIGLGFEPGHDDEARLVDEINAAGENFDPDHHSPDAVLHTIADILEDPGGYLDEAKAVRRAAESIESDRSG